jgi:hypothetical protein
VTLTVEELALSLQCQYGLDAETARRRAEAAIGLTAFTPATSTPVTDIATARENALEKVEQNAIRKMAIGIGFTVYWLSQARRTGQTPGLADLWLAHRGRGFCAWWESKRRKGGSRSAAQIEFGELCELGRIPYGHGDRHAFAVFLREHGFTPPPIPRD